MLLRFKSRAFRISILLIFIITAFPFIHYSSRTTELPIQLIKTIKSQSHAACPDQLDWLSELNLTYPITYARREIIVNSKPGLKRASLTTISEKLFPAMQRLDLADDAAVDLKNCKKPLVLDVPALPKDAGDASPVVFGISTTLGRLEASIPQLIRWLPNTNARLFAIVIDSTEQRNTKDVAADPKKKQELQTRMRNLQMHVTLVEPLKLEDTFAEKYFSLLRIMYENRNEKTQWISTIDDDTFFPSIPALLSTLEKYDAQEMHYISSVSEEWWAVAHYGMMGFGGAGIFISIALAKVIADKYQHCKDAVETSSGDMKIMQCVYELTDVKLTNERDLHQIDIHGDLSGLFESGRMPLSLHHWKPGAATLEGYDVAMMHQVSNICQDCFLQRWRFANNVILSNGFSIAQYPNNGLREMKLYHMEQTWSPVPSIEASHNPGVDHSLGPTRRKLELNKEKIQYRLIHSVIVNGGVRQVYFHRGVDGVTDTVLELFWRKVDNGKGISSNV